MTDHLVDIRTPLPASEHTRVEPQWRAKGLGPEVR